MIVSGIFLIAVAFADLITEVRYFSNSDCSGEPLTIHKTPPGSNGECPNLKSRELEKKVKLGCNKDDLLRPHSFNEAKLPNGTAQLDCVSTYERHLRSLLGTYTTITLFKGKKCAKPRITNVISFVADGKCKPSVNGYNLVDCDKNIALLFCSDPNCTENCVKAFQDQPDLDLRSDQPKCIIEPTSGREPQSGLVTCSRYNVTGWDATEEEAAEIKVVPKKNPIKLAPDSEPKKEPKKLSAFDATTQFISEQFKQILLNIDQYFDRFKLYRLYDFDFSVVASLASLAFASFLIFKRKFYPKK